MSTFNMNRTTEEAFHPKEVYAIYLRKSRADLEAEKLGEGETLTRHKKILTELAARKGLYVGEIYQEIISGAETIEARPEIQRLINDCYAGKYKGIIIVEVTRLSRGSQADAQKILDCLKYSNMNSGVLVITPTKIYDVAHNQEDEEYMEFELFMSRREYRMIQKRMDRGRKQAVVEGNYMGSYRPYGYNILKTKTMRTLTPNPDEAPIVKQIYKWAVEDDLSAYKIAHMLTARGIPTYHGEHEWSIDTVKTILTNPTYMGKVRWNDRMQVKRMVDGELVSSRPRTRNSDHYMLYDGKHKDSALVDEEMFKKASSRFQTDRTNADLKLVNPLAGVFVCKNCGSKMSYQSMKHKENVAPRYTHRSGRECKVKSVVAQDVIDAVIHGLKMYIEEFEIKLDGISDVDESSVEKEIADLNAEIRKTEKKLNKLFVGWEDDAISDNEFVLRKSIHNTTIENLRKQIRELEIAVPEKEEYEDKLYKLHDCLDAMLNDDVEVKIKNMYMKELVDKIAFSRENKEEFILDITLR